MIFIPLINHIARNKLEVDETYLSSRDALGG